MKTSKLTLCLSLSSVFLLSSCSQTPAPVQSTEVVVVAPEPVAEAPTAETFPLELAPIGNDEPIVDSNVEVEQAPWLTQQYALLAEARQLLDGSNPVRLLAISYHLRDSLEPNIRRDNQLPLLQGLLANQQYQAVDQLLSSVQINAIPQADQSRFSQLAAEFLLQQQRPAAAVAWLFAFDEIAGNTAAVPAMQQLLWQHLLQLSDAEIQQLSQQARPRARAWLELLQLSLAFQSDANAIAQGMQDWQRRHPAMPELNTLPAEILQLSQTQAYQPQRIGVILPLSGQMKTLGESVQRGLITASSSNSSQQLIFIDSQQDATSIYQALQQAQVEFVIGPLLREDVDKIHALPEWPWPSLFLNSKPQEAPLKAEHFYFALSVEDEALQMVELFRQKQYQHPILIHALNPINQRIAQRFNEQWQAQTGKAVEAYQYSSQDELRQVINTFLETAASRERVSELEKLSGRPIKAEMHSRLDIDAIFVVADPTQTRLLKPFIDVTVSPTAPALPIYASSRSHSLAIDRTDIRDLSGLTLTEMPWMLPLQPTPALRAEYEQWFAEQDETQQRLFAMGHDAMQLIGRLKQQQQVPTLVVHGLTGHLRLTSQQTIQRQLTLARYSQGKLSILSSSAATP